MKSITLYQINTYENGKVVAMSKTNRGKPHGIVLYQNAIKRLRDRKKAGKISSGRVTFEGSLHTENGIKDVLRKSTSV